MAEPTSDKHYEEKFEFPMWKLIKQRAEEKDTSYATAADQVIPEYVKTTRFGDAEFEDAEIMKSRAEMAELGEREEKSGIRYKDTGFQELIKRLTAKS